MTSALCNLQWFYTNTAWNVACSFPAGFLHKDIDEFVQLVQIVWVESVCRWRYLHYVTCSGSIQIQCGMLLAVFQQDSYAKTLMCFQLVQVVWVESVCRWWCPHYVTCSSQLLSVQLLLGMCRWNWRAPLHRFDVLCLISFCFYIIFLFFSQCSAEVVFFNLPPL